jgi:hypothetical protein
MALDVCRQQGELRSTSGLKSRLRRCPRSRYYPHNQQCVAPLAMFIVETKNAKAAKKMGILMGIVTYRDL